jgi:glycosyltransferase involved in cell wall biosynthesis
MKIEDLTISIIIPTYKRNHLAKEAIDSVLRQSNVENIKLEIIVSDDEDDNNIISKNQKYFESLSSNITYRVNNNKEGPGGNRQTGLKLSKGKFLVFLDDDDVLKSDFISIMLLTLRQDRLAQAVVCLSNKSFERTFSVAEKIKRLPHIIIQDIGLVWCYVFNKGYLAPNAYYLAQLSHMMFKSNSLKNFKFNYDYRRGGEDWDLVIHVLKKGNIKIIPQRLLKFRFFTGGSTYNEENLKKKWNSYLLLLGRIPKKFKTGLFYIIWLYYIGDKGNSKSNNK